MEEENYQAGQASVTCEAEQVKVESTPGSTFSRDPFVPPPHATRLNREELEFDSAFLR